MQPDCSRAGWLRELLSHFEEPGAGPFLQLESIYKCYKVFWFLFCFLFFKAQFFLFVCLFLVKWRKDYAVVMAQFSSFFQKSSKTQKEAHFLWLNPEEVVLLADPWVHASGSWLRAAAAKLSLQNWLLHSPCACRLHLPSWSCCPQSPGTGGPLNTGLSVASGEPRNLCPSQSVNWNTSKWSSWLPKDPQLRKNKPAAYAWQGQWVSAWSFLDQGFKWPF